MSELSALAGSEGYAACGDDMQLAATKNPGHLLQGIRGFPLKKRIKMKRTVSCRYYITRKLLTNPTSVVTKGLNRPTIFL